MTPAQAADLLEQRSQGGLADALRLATDAAKFGATARAEDQWKNLADSLDPNLKALLSSALPDLKGRLEPVAKKAEETVRNAALENGTLAAAEAIAQGDFSAAATAIAGSAMAASAGTAARVEAADGPVAKLEAASSGLSGLMAGMGEMLRKLMSSLASLLPAPLAKMLGFEVPADSAAVTESGQAPADGLAAQSRPLGEPVKSLRENADEAGRSLFRELGVTEDKRDQFFTIFAKYRGRVSDRWNQVAATGDGNVVTEPLFTLGDSAAFTCDLVSAGIIPLDRVAVRVAEGAADTVVLSVKTVGAMAVEGAPWAVHQILGKVSVEKLGKDWDSLSADQKNMMAALIHREGLVPLMVGGFMGQLMAEALVIPATWSERVGWNAAKMAANGVFGKFDKAAEGLDYLLGKLGDPEAAGSARETCAAMRARIVESRAKMFITDAFVQSVDGATDGAEAISQLRQKVAFVASETKGLLGTSPASEKLLAELDGLSTAVGRSATSETARAAVDQFVRNVHCNALNQADLRLVMEPVNYARGAYANPKFNASIFKERLDALDGGLARTVNSGVGPLRAWQNFRNLGNMVEANFDFNRAVVQIRRENADAWLKNLKVLATESPDLVRGLFGHLPAIVVIGVAANEEGNFAANFAKGMMFLTPIIGPGMLIFEGGKMENFKLPQLATMGMGTTLMAMDAYGVYKVASGPRPVWEALKFAARGPMSVLKLAGGASRTGHDLFYALRGIGQAARAGQLEQAGFAALRGLGTVGALAMLAYGGYRWHEWSKVQNEQEAQEKIAKDLKADGLIDENGAPVAGKMVEKFHAMEDAQKKPFVELLASDILSRFSLSQDAQGLPACRATMDGSTCKLAVSKLVPAGDLQTLVREMEKFGLRTEFAFTDEAVSAFVANAKDQLLTTLDSGQRASYRELAVKALTDAGVPAADSLFPAEAL